MSQHKSVPLNGASADDPVDGTGSRADMASPGRAIAPGRAIRRMLRWGLGALTFTLLLMGVAALALRFLIWPSLDDWRPRLEAMLSAQFEARVRIDALEPGFQGWRPMLAVRRLSVTVEGSQPEWSFERAHAVMSVRALLQGRFELASLEIVDAVLRVERLEPRRWLVGGMLVDLDRRDARSGSWGWLLGTRDLALRGLRVDWTDRLGGGATSLGGIELLASRDANRHQAALTVPRFASLANGLDLRIDATLAPGANPIEFRHWRGEWHARLDEVDLRQLGRELSRSVRGSDWAPVLRGGRGPMMIWSEFAEGEWRDVLVKTRLEGLDLASAGQTLPVRALEVEARARRGLGALIEVEIDRLHATDGAGLAIELDDRPQRILLDAARLRPVEVALSSRGFDAGALLAATQRLPLAEPWRRSLSSWRASGRVESVGVTWRARADRPDYRVRLDVQRLSLRSVGRVAPNSLGWPSASNLGGRIELDPEGGRAWIDSRQMTLTFPGLFAQPALNLASVAGEFSWRLPAAYAAPAITDAPNARAAQAIADAPNARAAEPGHTSPSFDLMIESLRFSNADLAAKVSGSYRYSGAGPGIVDLRGDLSRATASRVARYLPLTVGAATRAWVTRAVRAGQVDQGRFILRGDLRQFPFRDPAQGEFLVETRLQGGQLQYAPEWPAIDAIDARLRFERAGLSILAERARASGVSLSGVTAGIEDFLRPELKLGGQAQGAAARMMDFLRESPLARRVDPAVLDFDLAAQGRLDLSIEMPLHNGGGDTRYRGEVALTGGRLLLARDVPPLDSLSASIGFANDRFSVDGIRASLLGGAVEASARLGRDGRLRVEGRGRADAGDLERWLVGRKSALIEGATAYQFTVDTGGGAVSLNLDSDLQGVSSRLPTPLAKVPDELWPLQVEWRRSRAQAVPVEQFRARLRGEFLLETERQQDQATGRFERLRGSLSLGSRAERLDRGFSVAVHLPYLEVENWQSVAARLTEPLAGDSDRGGSGRSLSGIDRLAVSADTVNWAGRMFGRAMVLGALQGDRWRFRVQGEQGEGVIDWQAPDRRDAAGALIARFGRLEIPASVGNDRNAPAVQPSSGGLPAFDLEVDRLVLAGRALGSLRLNAVNAGNGPDAFWRLDRLELAHPGGLLSASGTWRPLEQAASVRSGSAGTELDFRLALGDPGRVLSTFGVQGALSGGAGTLSGRLAWEGSPLSIHYPSISGWLDIELGRGQFLKTEPGIAKLIGVLNLQSLPRRLSLDFRDVFAEGFAFDEIRGAASLSSGIARTDAFTMRGVQALVEIRGEADLTAETQHLNIQVRPELNAGLASLAYAAMANPAVGLGSFVAQLALRKPLRDIFSYEYEVKGSWSDPAVIERARPRIEAPQP